MNQAKLTERQILIRLLLAGNTLGNKYAKQAFVFYRPLFLDYFSQQKNFKKPLSFYQNSFNILNSELIENQGFALGNGTLFSSLILIGWSLAKKESAGTVHPEGISSYSYADSDLLLSFLQQREDYPLAATYLQEHFKKPAFSIYAKKSGYAPYQHFTNQDVYDNAYSKSMEKLLEHVQNGRVKQPMRATVFTYFYNVFTKDMSDEKDKKENRPRHNKDLDELGDKLKAEDEYNEDNAVLVDWFRDHFEQLRRYDFQNEGELIHHLLSQVSELCAKLLKLHYLEGLAYSKIAEEHEIPNAKSQASNCRKRLRDLLHGGN
jgi:RNA polymerase sigma factor (sigma-70 family)